MTTSEKLSMPGVRWAVARFSCSTLALVALVAVYLSISCIFFLSVPVFQAEFETVREEAWRARTTCDGAAKMVVLDCSLSPFNLTDSSFLTDAIGRTLKITAATFSAARFLIENATDCSNEHGWCRSALVTLMDLLLHHQTPILFLSWLSTTLMIVSRLLQRWPISHAKMLAQQLKDAENASAFDRMPRKQKQEFFDSLTSTAAADPFPFMFQQPGSLYGQPMIPQNPADMIAQNRWPVQDEQKLLQEHQTEGLRQRNASAWAGM
jgi:hypothetical protein